MSTDVNITYVNNVEGSISPTIYVFGFRPDISGGKINPLDAWRVLENIGRGSSSVFTYPIETSVRAMWEGTTHEENYTQALAAEPGQKFAVVEDDTGIILKSDGSASSPTQFEIANNVTVESGITAQILKDGLPLVQKRHVDEGQQASFVLFPKIWWVASETRNQGTVVETITSEPFETDLTGLESIKISLTFSSDKGFEFTISEKE